MNTMGSIGDDVPPGITTPIDSVLFAEVVGCDRGIPAAKGRMNAGHRTASRPVLPANETGHGIKLPEPAQPTAGSPSNVACRLRATCDVFSSRPLSETTQSRHQTANVQRIGIDPPHDLPISSIFVCYKAKRTLA